MGEKEEELKKLEKCRHLEDLLKQQVKIIERHIDKHKWYKGIARKEEALQDFVDKYGWILREAYCDLCPENNNCQAYEDYLANKAREGAKEGGNNNGSMR